MTTHNVRQHLHRLFVQLHDQTASDSEITLVDLADDNGPMAWFQSGEQWRQLLTATPVRSPFPYVVLGFAYQSHPYCSLVQSTTTGLELMLFNVTHIRTFPLHHHDAVQWVTVTTKGDGRLDTITEVSPNQLAPAPEAESCVMFSLSALAMFHVKNIELRPLYVERSVRRSVRRNRPIESPGPVIYHTIIVRPFRDATARGDPSAAHDDGRVAALHLVRGNFASYSEEHPLFGKYPGTFWRPWHVAGNRSVGLVRKTYNLDPNG